MQFHRILFQLLLILAIIILIFYMYKNWKNGVEGFSGFDQSETFLLKTGDNTYDDFYVEVYDDLMDSKKQSVEQANLIIKTVPIEKETDHILDIGSGTGTMVKYLDSLGYKAEGLEQSDEMIKKSIEKYRVITIKQGNALDPMQYDRATFTHILCTNFTIYEFVDKLQLLENCYFWLQGNGYFIIHLVDRDEYDPIIPAALGGNLFDNDIEKGRERITTSEIDYTGYTYKSIFDFIKGSSEVRHKETFVDKKTGNIRQNERSIYMEDHHNILDMAAKAGFKVRGNIPLENKAQWLFILERTL
jgi:SAM-dependent methyltransferase